MKKLTKRVASFYSSKENLFLSCEILYKNTLLVLEESVSSVLPIDADSSADSLNFELRSFSPDILVIFDNKVEPVLLFSKIDKRIVSRCKVFFFTFGLFYRRANKVIETFNLFPSISFVFVCFSQAQKRQLASTLTGNIALYHPPISPNDFFFDIDIRDTARKKFALSDANRTLLYTGRVSYQKKLHRLIDSFKIAKKEDPYLRLFIIGKIDNINEPHFSNFFCNYSKQINDALKDSTGIYFINKNLSPLELNSYYNMADCFISLSCHHDEIYGFSPREALLTGMQCILSPWGGYRDLSHRSNVSFFDTKGKNSELSDQILNLNIENNSTRSEDSSEVESSLLIQVENMQRLLTFTFNRDKIKTKWNVDISHNLNDEDYHKLYRFF